MKKEDYFCYEKFWTYLFKVWCKNYDYKKRDFRDEIIIGLTLRYLSNRLDK